jgi:sugar phosphate isomerase/epimerase
MHDRISVNAICFPGKSLRELPGIWREVGASRVSLVGVDLQQQGRRAAQDALATGRYKLETIPHVFFQNRSVERDENSWRTAREELSRMIDDAKALGARSIYMITGGHGALTWEDAAECFAEALAPCLAQAKLAGIPLMIEDAPPLYAHTHLAHSLRDTVTLAEIAGVGVCIDFFACWAEAGLRESIRRAVPRCHIVQVCDYVYGDRSLPARAVPGDGAIPVKRMIDWILEAGYTGVFDLEIIGPRIDQEGHAVAARRATDRIGEILQSLGA